LIEGGLVPVAEKTKIAIMASRHSAFYSPLIGVIAGGFLKEEGLEADYAVLQPGQRSREMLAGGTVDVMQSAVGSNWGPMEDGESDLPIHFAQINRCDGFFLAGRAADPAFDWKKLEGSSLVADHGHQPLLMLKYAAHTQGVDWSKISVIDAGSVEEMDAAFRKGQGDYIHLQGPAPQQLEHDGVGCVVASVGAAMPPVAFSSLLATKGFLKTKAARLFVRAYRKSRQWAHQAPAEEIADREASFFPAIDRSALAAAIKRYQQLGAWDGELAIPKNLYEQALEVFLHGGAITRRHPYEQVCSLPPA
jgi:NitT/TauT family transport system substrate-binding protein